jgi:hypothetical protein
VSLYRASLAWLSAIPGVINIINSPYSTIGCNKCGGAWDSVDA